MEFLMVSRDAYGMLVSTDVSEYGPGDRELQRFEVTALAALYFPPNEIENAVNVARLESAFHTGAWNQDHEDSRGLWQINVVQAAHPDLEEAFLFDPQVNAYYAYQIYKAAGDWSPWLNSATKLNLPGGR